MDFVIAIILGALGSLIAAEVYANGPAIADALIQRAVRRLPEHDRARFLEEWRADNTDCSGSVQKIIHAIGCCLGAPSVAKSLMKPRASSNKARSERTSNVASIQRPKRTRVTLQLDGSVIKLLAEVQARSDLTRIEMQKLRNLLVHSRSDRETKRLIERLHKVLRGG